MHPTLSHRSGSPQLNLLLSVGLVSFRDLFEQVVVALWIFEARRVENEAL